MNKYGFKGLDEDIWIVEAKDQHEAIGLAVENGFTENMGDFYYGLEDGQIEILTVVKELSGKKESK